MPDMLVKLYDLPSASDLLNKLSENGITIRHPQHWEKDILTTWVGKKFNKNWALECEQALSFTPPKCFIAIENKKIVGFACYDSPLKNFFGPVGVDESMRGKNVGKALLIVTLQRIKDNGYGYAIIGGVGPAEFYTKMVGATIIDGSVPGVYTEALEE